MSQGASAVEAVLGGGVALSMLIVLAAIWNGRRTQRNMPQGSLCAAPAFVNKAWIQRSQRLSAMAPDGLPPRTNLITGYVTGSMAIFPDHLEFVPGAISRGEGFGDLWLGFDGLTAWSVDRVAAMERNLTLRFDEDDTVIVAFHGPADVRAAMRRVAGSKQKTR